MGLVIDIKGWPVEALVAMATEGISVSYGEVICGGDKSLDRKIGRMLDKGKVLAAVEKLPEHLSSWLLVAYAAPSYISESRAQAFYDTLIGEFIARYIDASVNLPESKWGDLQRITPLICYDVARTNCGGHVGFKSSEYIAVLADIGNLSIKSLRSNWRRDWLPTVSLMKEILNGWDFVAKRDILIT